MEKTYYKNLVVKEKSGIFVASAQISDEPDGFFMPVVFEGKTKEEAESKMNKFLGDYAERV